MVAFLLEVLKIVFCCLCFDEGKPVDGHIPGSGVFPPYIDGIGKVRIIAGKCFDGQPTVILDGSKAGKEAVWGFLEKK